VAEGLLDDLRQDLRAPSDPLLEDWAAEGERLVAYLRLATLALVLLFQFLPMGQPELGSRGWAVLWLALAWGVAAYAFVQRPRAWLGALASVMDVSLVSLGLLAAGLTAGPQNAVAGATLFGSYSLVILASTLRSSWRLCALSGALALVQYGALAAWAVTAGAAQTGAQAIRLAQLLGLTVLCVLVALHGVRLGRAPARDRLTGLRRWGDFEAGLATELVRARRYSRPLVAAMCDVDHFGQFSKDHGHAAAEAALQVVATLFHPTFRRTDVVARLGSQFALVLPETRPGDAWQKLETLRLAVAATPLAARPGWPPVSLTLSVGLAAWPGDSEDPESLLATADARLREAKADGRNRVLGPVPVAPPAVR
jgi:diguanylate cyclase (GGDEF)-like protein